MVTILAFTNMFRPEAGLFKQLKDGSVEVVGEVRAQVIREQEVESGYVDPFGAAASSAEVEVLPVGSVYRFRDRTDEGVRVLAGGRHALIPVDAKF